MTEGTAPYVDADPVVVYDMPAREYFARPELSQSGAKLLLPPSCPAAFDYWRDHPRPDTAAFDEGHAAHALALGVGQPIVHVPGEWRSAALRAEVAAIRAAGGTPLHTEQMRTVLGMAKALRRHPIVGNLFSAADGFPEVTILWTETAYGIRCKARLDWLVWAGRWLIVDYKSTTRADGVKFGKSIADFGYHQQDDWYREAVEAALPSAVRPAFLFIAQEKTPPYLINVGELGEDDRRIGAAKNRVAREVYAGCTAAGVWPGYADSEVSTFHIPAYADRDY